MKFDRIITIYEPGFGGQDQYGNTIPGELVAHRRRANRKDVDVSETKTGSFGDRALIRTVLTIPFTGIERINTDWFVEMDGVEFRIRGILETGKGRRMYAKLLCEQR